MDKCNECPIGCEEAKKVLNDPELNTIKCKLTGIWIYKTLPEGMRLATRDDINPNGRRVVGLRYLLFSSVSELYEAYPLTENTDLPNLIRFVDAGKCWIKK